MSAPLTFAVPKGRILDEALPLMARAGLVPEPAFHDKSSRALSFACENSDTRLIRVRAFDVATGAERWKRDVVSEAGTRIEIAGGVVYVGTVDGAVIGLDLQTGADRWSWQGDPARSVRVDLVADGVVHATRTMVTCSRSISPTTS